MSKKTILFIDDHPNYALEIIQHCIDFYKEKELDCTVHLISVVEAKEENVAQAECDEFKAEVNDRRSNIFNATVIPYQGTKEHFDGYNSNLLYRKILDTVKKSTKKTPFSVALDLMLFDKYDVKRISNEERVLSHLICEEYIDKCALYSNLQVTGNDNSFGNWHPRLNSGNVKVPSFYFRTPAPVDYYKLAEMLYVLAK